MRYSSYYAEPSTGPKVVVLVHDGTDWWRAFEFIGPTLDSCVEAVSEWIAKGAWHADPWPHRARMKTKIYLPRIRGKCEQREAR